MSNIKDNKGNLWVFSKKTSSFSASDFIFSFIARREKHPQTHEESLILVCQKDQEENGTVITNLFRLERDIKQFQKYGVTLKNTDFFELAHAIQEHYLDIDLKVTSNAKVINNNIIKGVLGAINEYINSDKEFDKEGKKEFYIATKEFEEILFDDFGDYDCLEIRKELAKQGYIITSEGRTSKLTRINGKPVRTVAFDLRKLQEII